MDAVRVNGVVLHHAVEGPAAAPALVFSNSLGSDFRIWDRLVACLDGQFHIVRYDKRGHGLSGAPPAPYRMDDHVDDLAALLDHLRVDQAVICGVSVGGMIAQDLAARRPERIAALVLCDTAARIGTPDLWNERIAAIEDAGIESIADAIIERWLSARFRAARPEETAAWRNMLVRTPVAGYTGTCAAIRDADLTAATRNLTMPVLGVCGSEDGATPPDLVRETIGLIAGARFEAIDGAGHLPSIERPEILAGLMTDFLGEIGIV